MCFPLNWVKKKVTSFHIIPKCTEAGFYPNLSLSLFLLAKRLDWGLTIFSGTPTDEQESDLLTWGWETLLQTYTGREYSNQPFPWPVHEETLMAVQRLRNAELESLVSATSRRRVIHQADQNQTWTPYGLSHLAHWSHRARLHRTMWPADANRSYKSCKACEVQRSLHICPSTWLILFIYQDRLNVITRYFYSKSMINSKNTAKQYFTKSSVK